MGDWAYRTGEITNPLLRIANAIDKIANAYVEKQTPATYNIYVNTTADQPAEDIAAAVQAAMDRPKS